MFPKKLILAGLTASFVILLLAANRSEAQTLLQNMERDFILLVKKVNPAIVEVRATKKSNIDDSSSPDPDARTPRGGRGRPIPDFRRSIGSGIIIDKDGYVVTTASVVENSDKIEIFLFDGRNLAAKLIGIDSYSDVAVIKIEAKSLSVATLGNSDEVMSGSWVITVGKSYGRSLTLSFGIVNGIEPFPGNAALNAIKMSASINPGNSGGAVVNTSGQVVGVIAAALAEPRIVEIQPYSPQAPQDRRGRGDRPDRAPSNPRLKPPPSNEARLERMRASFMSRRDTSLAIPINEVAQISKQLIQHGQVQRGWLGIHIQPLSPEQRTNQTLAQKGVLVRNLSDLSPAAKAGIRKGDIILEFEGKPIHSPRDLHSLVLQHAPGNDVKIKIYRDNREQNILVTLGAMPKNQ